jgi:hypothetical protein
MNRYASLCRSRDGMTSQKGILIRRSSSTLLLFVSYGQQRIEAVMIIEIFVSPNAMGLAQQRYVKSHRILPTAGA